MSEHTPRPDDDQGAPPPAGPPQAEPPQTRPPQAVPPSWPVPDAGTATSSEGYPWAGGSHAVTPTAPEPRVRLDKEAAAPASTAEPSGGPGGYGPAGNSPASPFVAPATSPGPQAQSEYRPEHDQPSYGQPAHNQPAYGQPAYGQHPPAQWQGSPGPGYTGQAPTTPLPTSTVALLVVSGLATLSFIFTLAGIVPLVMSIVALVRFRSAPDDARRLTRFGWMILVGLVAIGILLLIGFIAFIATTAPTTGFESVP